METLPTNILTKPETRRKINLQKMYSSPRPKTNPTTHIAALRTLRVRNNPNSKTSSATSVREYGVNNEGKLTHLVKNKRTG